MDGARGLQDPRVPQECYTQAMAEPRSICTVLEYQPPLDLSHTLGWMESRLIKGVEAIEEGAYLRLLCGEPQGKTSWIRVRPSPTVEHALELQSHNVSRKALPALIKRVRRVFDLDADPHAIGESLGQDPRLAPLVQARPGLRIPGAWDGFETAMRAVIGQQVSVAAAHTITQRVMQRVALPLESPPHPALTMRFGGIHAVLDAELSQLGLTQRRIDCIYAVGRALLEERVSFDLGDDFESWLASWVALPGIGPWTASYLALRVLGYPDVFPGGDLVLRKALTATGQDKLPTPAVARKLAETWSPWRSYAAFHLWHDASNA